MNLRNKTTLEFRTDFGSPLGVPNSQVSLYIITNKDIYLKPMLLFMGPKYIFCYIVNIAIS